MSVLIKGMEMPDCGYVCLKVCANGDVLMTKEVRGALVVTWMNEKVGTAIPVPPHGRLIDADALMKLFGMGADCHTLSNGDDGFRLKHSGMGADCYNCQHGDSHGQCGFGPLFSDICEALDNAPVIIEEEQSDD